MFSCNVLRCEVCLECNFLVGSCSYAFFSFSFWNMHIVCLTKCLAHCLNLWFVGLGLAFSWNFLS
jgi:hypothetical protein